MIGAVDDLIVHVGVVHHVLDVVSAKFKIAADDVEHDGRHGVPNMGIVIDRDSTDVHFDFVGFEGLEFFSFSGESVVDFQHVFLR